MNILDPIFYRTLFYEFCPMISPGLQANLVAGICLKEEGGRPFKTYYHVTYYSYNSEEQHIYLLQCTYA
jgi:hypothetical protein